MVQLNVHNSFTPGAQFSSRKALYAARDEYHRKTGYKMVVKNCNKEQVIFVCHQHNAIAPKVKCPLQVRANSGKKSDVWTISPKSEIFHLCNVEDHPLPSKSAKGVAEYLTPRISSEYATLPTAPARIETLKSTEGSKPSLKTVYRECSWAETLFLHGGRKLLSTGSLLAAAGVSQSRVKISLYN